MTRRRVVLALVALVAVLTVAGLGVRVLRPAGGTFRSVEPGGDEFHVVRGSRIVSLSTGLDSTDLHAECSGGAFVARVAITGDVDRVLSGWAEQVPGDESTTWSGTAGGTRKVRATALLDTETAALTMTAVTNAAGQTSAALEYCRE